MKHYSMVSMSVTAELEKDVLNIRVAEASAALLNGIHIIESLVYPKQFETNFLKMLQFECKSTGLNQHKIKVHDDQPIQETVSWHITGVASGRIVNVVVTSTFYTFAENRSGHRVITINGKQNMKPEFGGITVEDIWQESGCYLPFVEGNPHPELYVAHVGRNNKLVPSAH